MGISWRARGQGQDLPTSMTMWIERVRGWTSGGAGNGVRNLQDMLVTTISPLCRIYCSEFKISLQYLHPILQDIVSAFLRLCKLSNALLCNICTTILQDLVSAFLRLCKLPNALLCNPSCKRLYEHIFRLYKLPNTLLCNISCKILKAHF